MKRQFCDQGKDSELTDDDPLECSFYDFDPNAAASSSAYSPPLANSCCRKCKNCYGKSGSNPRHSDVAARLKEKSKKKKEAAEKESTHKDTCKNGQKQKNSEETNMNLDDLDENIAFSQVSGSGSKAKLRSSSNNSSVSCQTADFEEFCTYKVDCNCKNCQKRQKLCEELIAEEESSKKKKAKKKKKKNAKKNQDTVVDDNDDDSKVKPDTEDEDSHERGNSGSRNSNSVDPTSVDINQWIKVKNKNTANTHNLKNSISKSSLSNRSSFSSGNTLVASGSQEHEAEMESNGFKLIGGKDNAEKRRSSTLEGVTKDLDAMTITDLKNGLNAIEKARLLSIEANLAYLRGDLSDAIHLISQSIDCDGKSPEYFINRSFYYEKSKKYSFALKDAEVAIKLEEFNENYLEYSLYRKAKALAGLNRFEQVESVLKNLTKLLASKCKNDVQAYNSYVIVIEKELMINRLKKLVSADYTLPLARLYALKFGSIKTAVTAIDENIRLLEEAKANSIDLELHLKLINSQIQKTDDFTASSVKDSKLLSLIRASNTPQSSSSQQRRTGSKSSATQDLWNFNENEEESYGGDKPIFLRDILYNTGDNQKVDEEAFLSQYDDDDDDSEIYFSDEDEYEMVYSNPDKWNRPKDILNTGNDHYFTDELREPINSNGQKALWIGNVSPECSKNLVSHVFMKFGSVTFCNIFANERSNDIAYLLLHYDNDISPRLVTTYFKDQVVPKISKDNHPLIIRFRNKNDKGEECGEGSGIFNSGNTFPKNALISPNPQSPSHHHQPTLVSGTFISPNKQPPADECYYWRTTGCDRVSGCKFKHIPAHKGIDKKPWMKRKDG